MNNFDSSQITLSSPSKLFAYEQLSRDIEKCDDIVQVKDALRCYIKMYLKQQESLMQFPPTLQDESV